MNQLPLQFVDNFENKKARLKFISKVLMFLHVYARQKFTSKSLISSSNIPLIFSIIDKSMWHVSDTKKISSL